MIKEKNLPNWSAAYPELKPPIIPPSGIRPFVMAHNVVKVEFDMGALFRSK
jgi:hypothetical protein